MRPSLLDGVPFHLDLCGVPDLLIQDVDLEGAALDVVARTLHIDQVLPGFTGGEGDAFRGRNTLIRLLYFKVCTVKWVNLGHVLKD